MSISVLCFFFGLSQPFSAAVCELSSCGRLWPATSTLWHTHNMLVQHQTHGASLIQPQIQNSRHNGQKRRQQLFEFGFEHDDAEFADDECDRKYLSV